MSYVRLSSNGMFRVDHAHPSSDSQEAIKQLEEEIKKIKDDMCDIILLGDEPKLKSIYTYSPEEYIELDNKL